MERTLYKELKSWKDQIGRLPLIIRGARQVGKSFLVEQFGKREFSSFQVINFEKRAQLKNCFDSLDPKEILKELELNTGTKVQPGQTLLFLDEIQDCPQALKALRYFAEEMPSLHLIAAGSLLEFVLEDTSFSFPVGRVQVMNLGPLTFYEYLSAFDQQALVDFLHTVQKAEEISEGVHQRLLGFLREFLCVGGMPGVVSTFKATGSFVEAQRRQAAILDLYALDFGKYATKHAEYRHLKKLFEKAPSLVGRHFKFSKIDPDCANPARDYREALHRLQQARLFLPVHCTQANGLPLAAEKSEKKFKIFLLDVGLLTCGLGWETLDLSKTSSSLFRGVLAEQFVAQELHALQDPFMDRGLYYWENPNPGSEAEVDFLIGLKRKIVPIEVKSGTTAKLRSLKQFMQLKNIQQGICISEQPLQKKGDILLLPLYCMSEMGRLSQVC